MAKERTLYRLEPSSSIKPFDCNNKDLNEFLFENAKAYLVQLLSVTYLLETDEETIAYFNVSNDSIRLEDLIDNPEDKKVKRSKIRKVFGLIPHDKRGYESFPAVKIGRFAVNKKHQGEKIGTTLMDYIKGYFLDNNKTGCRFITLDAINDPKIIEFYKRNGFDFLTERDVTDDSRMMFFDLIIYASHLKEASL